MFTGMQNTAVATMAAVAAAVKNPTDAFDTFNETFDSTLASLETGQSRTNIYSDSIEPARIRVDELNEQLAGMNTEVATSDTNLVRTLDDLSLIML
jgi:hypothetical protein